MKVSQSLLREFEDTSVCNLVVYYKYIQGIQKPSSDAMKLGLAFESIVLGVARGGEDCSEDYPKTKRREFKNGKIKEAAPNAASKRMLDAAPRAKAVMKEVFPEWFEIQPEWGTEFLDGHPDLIADFLDVKDGKYYPKVIVDLKYITSKELSQTSWSYFDWSNVMSNDLRQSKQYVAMHFEKTGEIIPFVYAAFSGAGSWRIIHKIIWSVKEIEEHIQNVLEARQKMIDEGFRRTLSVKACEDCYLHEKYCNGAKRTASSTS
jgi:hypothetical protein